MTSIRLVKKHSDYISKLSKAIICVNNAHYYVSIVTNDEENMGIPVSYLFTIFCFHSDLICCYRNDDVAMEQCIQ